MKSRALVVLLALVIAFGGLIGLILTRSRPLSFEEAARLCQAQDPHDSPAGIAACIRAKQQPRPLPTSKAVLLVPLVLGGGAVLVLGLVGRRRPGGPTCPRCGTESVPGDEACVRCGHSLAGRSAGA